MKKNIIVFLVLIIIIWLLWILLSPKKTNKETKKTPMFAPTPTIINNIPTLQPTKIINISNEKIIIPTQKPTFPPSNTGAIDEDLSENEYKEVYLIGYLRKSLPINKTYFSISYDYKINKFVVKLINSQKGMEEFEKWREDTGYNVISKKYFIIK